MVDPYLKSLQVLSAPIGDGKKHPPAIRPGPRQKNDETGGAIIETPKEGSLEVVLDKNTGTSLEMPASPSKDDQQTFFDRDFGELDQALTVEERQEWNSTYTSYCGRSPPNHAGADSRCYNTHVRRFGS